MASPLDVPFGLLALEVYRHDLRGFFQWAADPDVPVLAAARPHMELWRGSMEERGLVVSVNDRPAALDGVWRGSRT